MTRIDAELGPMRLCGRCGEWWPDDEEFYGPEPGICLACVAEWRRKKKTSPLTRQRDRERKAAARRDPVRGPLIRERERVRALRCYHAKKGHAA